MLSAYRLRKARLEDSEAAHTMLTLSTERAQLRAAIIDAREAADHERERELTARHRQLDREYQAAADRRRGARRLLIDHHREERRQC